MAALEPENLQNLFSLYDSLGAAGIGPVLLRSSHYRIIRSPDAEWPNMAFGIEEPNFDQKVADDLARNMTDLGLRPTLIVPNGTQLTSVLRASGFLPVDQWLGMSYTGPSHTNKAGTMASILDQDKDIHSWTQTVSETLFNGKALDSRIFAWLQSRGAELVSITSRDEMAGSAMIYYDETGAAGIYMVGIREKFRKQGLGKELILFCLDRLKDRGVHKCYLQSTRMGTPLYRALNFQENDKYLIFCKIK